MLLLERMNVVVKECCPDLTEKEGCPALNEKFSGVGMVLAGDAYGGGPNLNVGMLCEFSLLFSGGWPTATKPP